MNAVRIISILGLSWLTACAGGTHLGQSTEAHVVLESATGDTGCTVSTAGTTFRAQYRSTQSASYKYLVASFCA